METALVMGEDALTLLDLLRRAATHKGLKLREGSKEGISEPIKEYVLDEKLLAVLEEYKIRRQDRPDCRNEIFTLIDENPQERVPGFAPSNYWNFKLVEGERHIFNLRVTLSVGFGISIGKRGVLLVPQAHGTFLSPADGLPHFRMFRALVENDRDAPLVAKELALSEGTILITWTELGLGGIRRLSYLFEEFTGHKETIDRLGRNGEVFDPNPFPRCQNPGEELFIPEPSQAKVFEMWRAQLDEYRSKLVVL